jgi:glycosyltransferase involved in cell wall biosynthesis
MSYLKQKNIIYIVHSYNNFQKDQIEILAKYFNHVYVLVRYKPIAEISKFLSISILHLHQKKNAIDLSNKPINITVIPVSLWYLPTKFGYKKLGKKHFNSVLRIINKNNIEFDFIHAHFTWTAGYVAAKLKEIYKKPFLLTVHEDNERLFDEYNSKDQNIYFVWRSADIIIRVNRNTIPLISKFNNNVIYISNGLNSDLFTPKSKIEAIQKLKLPLQKYILLNVAALEKQKGHFFLIQAMKILVENNNNIICFIIGDGGLKNNIQKHINKLNLQNNIKLLGALPHKEIATWMNACDIFVLPSISESFGIVQIEAMACGKPIIATINGGSEEIITSDKVGYLCKNKDQNDLAEKIKLALSIDWNKNEIIQFSEQYKLANICVEIKNLYTKFIDIEM